MWHNYGMHHLRGIHFSIIRVPTRLPMSTSAYPEVTHRLHLLSWMQILVLLNPMYFKENHLFNWSCFNKTIINFFLKSVLYATVTKSLVSIISINDHDPNSKDLSTKNKVHVSLVLLSGQKITYMQALVRSKFADKH